jgi:hypothetical protein
MQRTKASLMAWNALPAGQQRYPCPLPIQRLMRIAYGSTAQNAHSRCGPSMMAHRRTIHKIGLIQTTKRTIWNYFVSACSLFLQRRFQTLPPGVQIPNTAQYFSGNLVGRTSLPQKMCFVNPDARRVPLAWLKISYSNRIMRGSATASVVRTRTSSS